MDVTNSEFCYDGRILYKRYFGLISLEDIMNSWLRAMNENLIPQDAVGFVLDYRKAHFNFDPRRHTELTDFYKKHSKVFSSRRIAFVTVNPDDIVYPILIQTQDNGYESRPFSTMEAAVDWVSSGIKIGTKL